MQLNSDTAKPRILAYEILEYTILIITCQEKKLCLSYAICSYSIDWDVTYAFLTAVSNLIILIKAKRISTKK